MATGASALAKKLVSKKSVGTKETGRKENTKKSTSEKPRVSKSRSDVPWQEIADSYNKGLSVSEISDKLKLTRPKTKKGKENPYPYYLTVGYLTKLSHGVEVDGRKIQIVRGGKNKQRAAKKEKSASK